MALDGNHVSGQTGHVSDHNLIDTTLSSLQTSLTNEVNNRTAADTAHVSATGAHAATKISVTPTGGIASTDVQAALAEVDAEKAPIVEAVNTVGASGTAQTIPDPTTATISHITLTGNCTFTFPTAAAGKSFTLVLKQDATGSRTATWPGTVQWPSGTAPTLTTTAAKSDVLSFLCADGTNWIGLVGGQNI